MASAPPRPHLLARSRFARTADRVVAAIWDKGLDAQPALEPDALWAIGSKGFVAQDESHGRSAEDVADFRSRLEQVCQSLRQEAQLNALGHTMAYGQLTSAIRMRHALGRCWRENPGIEQTAISAPIIVVGQMRAGTTRMHRLLAADPAHAGTRLYAAMNPVRPTLDTRALKTRLGLLLARRVNPWLDTLHPFGATRVDEELPWLAHALLPVALEAQYRIPAYVGWSEARDPSPVYREFARMLRTDAALMGNAGLPRVLKCPQYAEDLPALLEQFPDARAVVTRRDGAEVLASTVSLVASQMAYQTDHACIDAIESEWQRKLILRDARMAQALASFDGPLAEVEFTVLNADWESEMARVYRALGLELSASALAQMRAEHARARHDSYHQHSKTYRALAQA